MVHEFIINGVLRKKTFLIYIVTNTFSPLILSEYFIVLIPCIRRYLQQVGHGAELLNIRVPSLLVRVELRTTIKVVFNFFPTV